MAGAVDERARAERAGRPLALGVGLVAVSGLVIAYALVRDLFVFTEARMLIHLTPPVDWLRLLLLPELDWGQGRLFGVAVMQASGDVCGVDAHCTNAAGALLVAVAAGVLVIHGRQVSRSLPIASGVAIAWLLSAPTLAVLLWQAARFDLLALIGALATCALWWAQLGRPRLATPRRVAFVAASVGLLALTLNTKESAYYLLGALPLVAVVRGAGIGRVRRNLLLGAVPLAYAAFFVGWALTHVNPAYAAYAAGLPLREGLGRLVLQSLGTGGGLLYIEQSGATLDALVTLARLGYAVFGAALLLALVVAVARARHRLVPAARPDLVTGLRDLLVRFGPEIYLLATIVALVGIGIRSSGAAAHYMLIPWWAAAMLVALVVRRVADQLPAGRRVAAVLLLLAVGPALVGYAGNLVEGSAYRQLTTASARMYQLGADLRELLGERPVNLVSWRTAGTPPVAYFVLRSGDTDDVGSDLWPYLVGEEDARPAVVVLEAGTPAELAARLGEFDGADEVLLVIDDDYRLVLLAHAGELLHAEPFGRLESR